MAIIANEGWQQDRNLALVGRVLDGESIAKVSGELGISRQRGKMIFHRDCRRINPEAYDQFKGNLTSIKLNKELFQPPKTPEENNNATEQPTISTATGSKHLCASAPIEHQCFGRLSTTH